MNISSIMGRTHRRSATRVISAVASLALLASAAVAQVPTMISYQSRVQVDGTNFTGNGQFKFALVQGAGPALLWKNDASGGNTEPTSAVTLPVANGLVMTVLGDTTLPNMTALPASAFANADVRLRVWFNGGPGFQQLTPDQRIVSVGYALMASTVPDGSITAAKLAGGVLSPTNFPPNSINSTQLADAVDLGTTNVNGRLDVYRTAAGTPGVSLIGGTSQISTYGSDGLEQTRLWGPGHGELLLNNGLANNATAVRLTAQSTSGGQLELLNTNGLTRALLEGENTGGALTLYQTDGQVGILLDGDSGGAGLLSLRGTNGSSRAILDAIDGGGALTLYQTDGQVGLVLDGDSGGAGLLSLRGTNGSSRAVLDASDAGGGALRLYESDGTETASLTAQNNGLLVLRQGDGSQGVGMSANNGTGGGGISVYRDNGTFAGQLTVSSTSGFLGVANSNGVNRVYAQGSNPSGSQSGYIGLINSGGSQTITLDADAAGDGRITTQVLQITGGSDLSENFDIKPIHDDIQSGMIVCIDPEHPGRLVPSTRAYDTSVAGIISGAGGVKPGMLMGQRGTVADGKHPVALTGRVYCWVDADAGAIKAGDLITTSDTPGHGMKVKNHKKAQGAIIGKAMSSLEKGKDLVLVLVSLQ